MASRGLTLCYCSACCNVLWLVPCPSGYLIACPWCDMLDRWPVPV